MIRPWIIEQRHDPLDDADLDLASGQSQDPPSRQGGFEIFPGIAGVTAAPCVSATGPHENPAFDIYQRPAVQVGEVGAPFPRRVEAELALQGGDPARPGKRTETVIRAWSPPFDRGGESTREVENFPSWFSIDSFAV